MRCSFWHYVTTWWQCTTRSKWWIYTLVSQLPCWFLPTPSVCVTQFYVSSLQHTLAKVDQTCIFLCTIYFSFSFWNVCIVVFIYVASPNQRENPTMQRKTHKQDPETKPPSYLWHFQSHKEFNQLKFESIHCECTLVKNCLSLAE